MTRYRLVIFDFDGTLADSAEWFVKSYNKLAGELGLRAVVEADLPMLRALTTREIMAFLKVPPWKLPRLSKRMREQAGIEADRIKLFPGIDTLLPALKERGVTLAIVSSNSEDNVRKVLGPMNVACIDVLDCSASLLGKARKLRAVIKRCGVTPQQTLCIGDELRDIDAAREVGADAASVLWGYAAEAALVKHKPTHVLRSVGDIVTLL